MKYERYAMLLFFQTLDTKRLEFKKVILVKETIEHVVADRSTVLKYP